MNLASVESLEVILSIAFEINLAVVIAKSCLHVVDLRSQVEPAVLKKQYNHFKTFIWVRFCF